MVTIPSDSLTPFLADALSVEASSELQFDPRLNLLDPATQSWFRIVQMLVADLNSVSPLLRTPLLSVHAEQLLIASFLQSQPNNLAADRPLEKRSPALKHVLQLMLERPEYPWRIAELAGSAGISVRAMQTQFLREFGIGPLAKLRQIRLKNVHRELAAASAEETSVAEVALRWGFGSLGRFAANYYRVFREYPSETLHK